jgi:hypothetical protein
LVACDDPNQVIDFETCTCVCADIVCPNLQILDQETCECFCPPDAQDQCAADEVLDPVECRCVPAPSPICDTCNDICTTPRPCGPTGSEDTCNCWVRADQSGCFCGPLPLCDTLEQCSPTGNCDNGFVCVENCCGRYCYPPCGAPSAQLTASDTTSGGPRGVR